MKIYLKEKIPFSEEHQDHYYSPKDGFQESLYHFCAPQLPKFAEDHDLQCNIGELGFGTGLNFFSTLHFFKTHGIQDRKFSFTSLEKYILPPDLIRESLEPFSEIMSMVELFIPEYESFYRKNKDVFQFEFSKNQVLTVFREDVSQALHKFPKNITTWYFDGFAPSRNEEMWSKDTLQTCTEHSVFGSTFATFSSQGKLKRNLQELGWKVEKRKGFAHKRECITGMYYPLNNVIAR